MKLKTHHSEDLLHDFAAVGDFLVREDTLSDMFWLSYKDPNSQIHHLPIHKNENEYQLECDDGLATVKSINEIVTNLIYDYSIRQPLPNKDLHRQKAF